MQKCRYQWGLRLKMYANLGIFESRVFSDEKKKTKTNMLKLSESHKGVSNASQSELSEFLLPEQVNQRESRSFQPHENAICSPDSRVEQGVAKAYKESTQIEEIKR